MSGHVGGGRGLIKVGLLWSVRCIVVLSTESVACKQSDNGTLLSKIKQLHCHGIHVNWLHTQDNIGLLPSNSYIACTNHSSIEGIPCNTCFIGPVSRGSAYMLTKSKGVKPWVFCLVTSAPHCCKRVQCVHVYMCAIMRIYLIRCRHTRKYCMQYMFIEDQITDTLIKIYQQSKNTNFSWHIIFIVGLISRELKFTKIYVHTMSIKPPIFLHATTTSLHTPSLHTPSLPASPHLTPHAIPPGLSTPHSTRHPSRPLHTSLHTPSLPASPHLTPHAIPPGLSTPHSTRHPSTYYPHSTHHPSLHCPPTSLYQEQILDCFQLPTQSSFVKTVSMTTSQHTVHIKPSLEQQQNDFITAVLGSCHKCCVRYFRTLQKSGRELSCTQEQGHHLRKRRTCFEDRE